MTRSPSLDSPAQVPLEVKQRAPRDRRNVSACRCRSRDMQQEMRFQENRRTIRSGTIALCRSLAEVKEALHLHCRARTRGWSELSADLQQEHSARCRTVTANSQDQRRKRSHRIRQGHQQAGSEVPNHGQRQSQERAESGTSDKTKAGSKIRSGVNRVTKGTHWRYTGHRES